MHALKAMVLRELVTLYMLVVLILPPFTQAQWDPNFLPGKTTIVHLFEWRWEDIAQECERFLGPRGFGGVQVQPYWSGLHLYFIRKTLQTNI